MSAITEVKPTTPEIDPLGFSQEEMDIKTTELTDLEKNLEGAINGPEEGKKETIEAESLQWLSENGLENLYELDINGQLKPSVNPTIGELGQETGKKYSNGLTNVSLVLSLLTGVPPVNFNRLSGLEGQYDQYIQRLDDLRADVGPLLEKKFGAMGDIEAVGTKAGSDDYAENVEAVQTAENAGEKDLAAAKSELTKDEATHITELTTEQQKELADFNAGIAKDLKNLDADLAERYITLTDELSTASALVLQESIAALEANKDVLKMESIQAMIDRGEITLEEVKEMGNILGEIYKRDPEYIRNMQIAESAGRIIGAAVPMAAGMSSGTTAGASVQDNEVDYSDKKVKNFVLPKTMFK